MNQLISKEQESEWVLVSQLSSQYLHIKLKPLSVISLHLQLQLQRSTQSINPDRIKYQLLLQQIQDEEHLNELLEDEQSISSVQMYVGWISLLKSTIAYTNITKSYHISNAYKYFSFCINYKFSLAFALGYAITYNQTLGWNLLAKSLAFLESYFKERQALLPLFTNIIYYHFGDTDKSKYILNFYSILQISLNDSNQNQQSQYLFYIAFIHIYHYVKSKNNVDITHQFLNFIEVNILNLQDNFQRQFLEIYQSIYLKLSIKVNKQQRIIIQKESLLNYYYEIKNNLREQKIDFETYEDLQIMKKYLESMKFSDYIQLSRVQLIYCIYQESELFRIIRHQNKQQELLEVAIGKIQNLIMSDERVEKLKRKISDEQTKYQEYKDLIQMIELDIKSEQEINQSKNKEYYLYSNKVLSNKVDGKKLILVKSNDEVLYMVIGILLNKEHWNVDEIWDKNKDRKEVWYLQWLQMKANIKSSQGWSFQQQIEASALDNFIKQFNENLTKLINMDPQQIGFKVSNLIKANSKSYFHYINSFPLLKIYMNFKTMLYQDAIQALQLLLPYINDNKNPNYLFHYQFARIYIKCLRFAKQLHNQDNINIKMSTGYHNQVMQRLDQLQLKNDQIIEMLDEVIQNCQLKIGNENVMIDTSSVQQIFREQFNYYMIAKSYYLQAELLKINGDIVEKDQIIEYYQLSYDSLLKFNNQNYLQKSTRLIPFDWFKKNIKS